MLPRCNGYDLFEINVDELQHLFSIGSLTSFQYTSFCLERIRRVGAHIEVSCSSLQRCPMLVCSAEQCR